MHGGPASVHEPGAIHAAAPRVAAAPLPSVPRPRTETPAHRQRRQRGQIY